MWDVLGAGGFLLSNFQAETPRFFKDGEDMVSYYSLEDLVERQASIWNMRRSENELRGMDMIRWRSFIIMMYEWER